MYSTCKTGGIIYVYAHLEKSQNSRYVFKENCFLRVGSAIDYGISFQIHAKLNVRLADFKLISGPYILYCLKPGSGWRTVTLPEGSPPGCGSEKLA